MLMILLAFTLSECEQECNKQMSNIPSAIIDKTLKELKTKFPQQNQELVKKGVSQVAAIWTKNDGTPDDFIKFCSNYLAPNDSAKKSLFDKLSYYFEILYGNLNELNIYLKYTLHVDEGNITPIDELFGSYDPYAHINDDLFNNKIAYITILNFPYYTLKEKQEFGKNWNSLQWAYARLGDIFTARIPASVLLKYSEAVTAADNYISEYNIYMGNLIDEHNNTLFPLDLKLISHWGLRDELKANYKVENGLEKQKMIYEVMKKIITQEIPVNIINNQDYKWNPYSNKLFKDGKEIKGFKKEPDTRYAHLLQIFKTIKDIDKYNPNCPNYIQRKFEQEIEIHVEEVEKLFINFISSDEVKQVAKLITKRLGRKLEPFDIWYDGFKARNSISQEQLDQIVKKKYPNKAAYEQDLPIILTKLGFDQEKVKFISSKVIVDHARGAGHAWGAMMRSEKARLRTRINKDGMDYKGYNIACHEFGHNVEQTITLNFVDYYMMNGVPNTAFTEALAFIFQKRDLELLGIKDNDPDKKHLVNLDIFWGAYEIMGVALVDINVWKWLYKHPEATPSQLKKAVLEIAKDIWNKYYAPVFEIKDQYILAIYSHMIDAPLYLSNYPLGHIIEFQIENYIENKNFASEIFKMYSQGRKIPQIWMQNAVSSEISIQPMLNAAKQAVEKLDKTK
ncbi:MAG TPA: hypothetical protein P5250_05160 [Bacteroidales bacterium]|nr:hypothetical protein [Bacteroidales bacterium]